MVPKNFWEKLMFFMFFHRSNVIKSKTTGLALPNVTLVILPLIWMYSMRSSWLMCSSLMMTR